MRGLAVSPRMGYERTEDEDGDRRSVSPGGDSEQRLIVI
jgi:hypothetical protein